MKKATSLLLVLVIIASLFSFSSCGDKEPQYDTVKLDKNNYSDYIVFNIYYTDLDVEKNDGQYEISCVIHAESSSTNADYRFENVTITLHSSKAGIFNRIGDITLNLDALGSSHGTAQHHKTSSLSGNINTDWGYKVKSITGNVLVPVN